MLNAAVWLGAAVFCSTALLVAINSTDTVSLLGSQYFPQVSGAFALIVSKRLFYLEVLCGIIAWLHLFAEWMYLGRTPRRWWIVGLTLLHVLALIGALWLCPKLARLQRAQYSANLSPASRMAAQHSFGVWDGVFQVVNVIMIGGIAVGFWRVTHPPDEHRFVSPSKFRG